MINFLCFVHFSPGNETVEEGVKQNEANDMSISDWRWWIYVS